MTWLYLAAFGAGYAIGHFSPAYLIVRFVNKADIRQLGSGNAGTANVNHVLGTRAALVVFFIDILKGALAVWVGQWIGGSWGGIFAGLAVVLGHNYPVLLGFRGGKGAATTAGLTLAFSPPAFFSILVVSILSMILWRTMSITSMLGCVLVPFALLVFGRPLNEIGLTAFLALLVLYQHRENIRRLLSGSEGKISFKP